MTVMLRTSAVLMVAALAVGCSDSPSPSGGSPAPAPASVEGGTYRLDAEPAGAKGVIAVRESAKDGDAVVVAGRVGGSGRPFTDGRAMFLIADESLKPTEGCDCPWDFCDYPKEERLAATATVKFVDEQGKTLPTGARELFGISELTTVVVKGKASRDDKGNLTVIASGLYVRK